MQQITISAEAQAHFRRLLDQQEEGTNIRIFVVNPGTPSAECGVSYCPPNSVEASDTEFKYDTFSAFVDDISLPFLEDAEIDYVTEELGAQLTLKAPNAKMRKVADDAPLIERVEYVIQTQINPQLASHGGKITLLEITDNGYAILQFGGGCNGCSMVDVTLKDGVEKQLISLFPDELKGEKVRGKEQNRSEAISVNIIGNLVAKNLYTLTFVEDSANQYNLESWFNRHESGYEEACNHLRTLPAGRLKTTTANADTVKVPDALWRILRLKFLSILRNPHNHKNLFAHRLHQTLRAQLPEVGFEFVRLISKRDPKRIEAIMQDYRFTFLGYVDWLGGLYGMLSEGVAQPSLFERLFCNIFAEPEAVKIELFRYPENTGLCLFGDSSFCLQASAKLFSVGVNISHDMFAVVHLQTDRWHAFKNTFHHDAPKLQGQVRIIDGDQTARPSADYRRRPNPKIAVQPTVHPSSP